MMEAKITCTTGKIQIPDLGLDLVAGQVEYVAEAKVRGSRDLQRARQAKGVSVAYVERSRVRRPATLKNPGYPTPSGVSAFLPAKLSQEEKVIFDPDAIAERVVAALGGLPLDCRISQEVIHQLQGIEDRLTNALVSAVERAMVQGHRKTQVEAEGSAGSMFDDVPVFIPSRIEDEGLISEIEVQSQQGDDTRLSDTAEALRVARQVSEKS